MTTWFYTVVAILIAAIVAGIMWAILAAIKRRNELINRAMMAEQKALITQMNPHFIFNCLNSIQNFFLTNDLENANDYLADFGSLIRLILDNGRRPKISLDREVLLLSLYMRLEALRLSHKFTYEIHTSDLDCERTSIPPMILQPFVENAIWHGIAQKEGNGQLKIHFRRDQDCLLVSIEDNGIGRKSAAERRSASASSHQSLATAITMERIEILRKHFPGSVSLEIIDLHNEDGSSAGTSVQLQLPIDVQNEISRTL
jgi:LytS/YehU family sensor histidine kinase